MDYIIIRLKNLLNIVNPLLNIFPLQKFYQECSIAIPSYINNPILNEVADLNLIIRLLMKIFPGDYCGF